MTKWTEFTFTLKPSNIAGLGVFAAHDIPKGMRLFSGITSRRRMITKNIPQEFIKYCIFINDEECFCPERFDRMEIGWYINHSDKPNIAKAEENYGVALVNIKAGEEILIDYNSLDEPEHLKEAYYKTSNRKD